MWHFSKRLYKPLIWFSIVAAIFQNITGLEDRIFSQMIIRHGDRTPKITWPTDLHGDDDSEWPTGFGGQMTMKGKQQCYELGKWIRGRYAICSSSDTLLTNGFSPLRIHIRSADQDRCIQCAVAAATAMFPPNPAEIVTPDQPNWQPIATHSVPEEHDNLLSDKLDACPAYKSALGQLYDSTLFRQLTADAAEVFANMSQSTGLQVSTITKALRIRAELKVHRRANKLLPPWAHSVLRNEVLNRISRVVLRAPTYTRQLATLRSGYLWKEILDRAVSNTTKTISMYMYSAHGKTMANLMNTLGVLEDNDSKPGSASILLFESYAVNAVPHMRMYYRNDTLKAEPTEIRIPGCESNMCPIDRLYNLYADVLPVQPFQDACGDSMGD